jgi:DMSO/TMAO reductase YedYZ molybdopterin-dependent catalytic subunit
LWETGLVAEEDALGGSPDPGHHPTDAEKPIGRRAFLGLAAAGVAAFVFGPGAFSHLDRWVGSGDSATSVVYKPQPIDLATWDLAVVGHVHKQLMLTWKDFLALPQTDETLDFTCVDGWRVQARRWKGVRLRELLDLAGLDESATHVVFHSADAQYTDSLTVAEARSDDILLAHTCNGELLTQDHGGPLRLVAPGRYGYKYVKWLTKVEVIAAGAKGYQGYWEARGYSVDAWIK